MWQEISPPSYIKAEEVIRYSARVFLYRQNYSLSLHHARLSILYK